MFRSVSNVPYRDQWPLLEEVWRLRTGQSGWSYLWSPYWGQRPLLPRLAILLSERYLHYSMLPFIVTSMAAQVSMLLVFVWLIRQLFPGGSRLFWVSTIAAAHLLLSSQQMEIFVEGIGIQYTIGYASAVGAIALLGAGYDSRLKFEWRFWIAILLGIASSACLAIGPLVWPILIFEAWLARAKARHLAVLAALAVLVIAAYSIGYQRPQIGLGFAGAIRHPIQAFRIAALVLGGPISLFFRWLGVAAGAIGVAIVIGILVQFGRTRSERPAAMALVLIGCFMIGSAAAIALGRISPEELARNTGRALPSRCLAPTLAFWAALFPVSLTCWRRGRMGRLAALGASLIVLAFTFGTLSLQWRLSREWPAISEEHDAIASGFLAGVSDPEYMSRIMADEGCRSRMLGYMRQRNLSVFAEPRARWMGQKLASIAAADDRTICRATIRKADRLDGDSPALRVAGTLTLDGRPLRRRLDVLITDDTGTVKGLARTLPIYSEYEPGAADFFGYAREVSPQTLRIFALFDDRVLACAP